MMIFILQKYVILVYFKERETYYLLRSSCILWLSTSWATITIITAAFLKIKIGIYHFCYIYHYITKKKLRALQVIKRHHLPYKKENNIKISFFRSIPSRSAQYNICFNYTIANIRQHLFHKRRKQRDKRQNRTRKNNK